MANLFFDENDIKKIVRYAIYDMASLGLLNEKGLKEVDNISVETLREFGTNINIAIADKLKHGEVT